MLRRVAWIILPALVLGTGAADASTRAATPPAARGPVVLEFPALSHGDRLIEIGTTDLPADNDASTGVGNGADAVSSDLGLAAAALANGPVTANRRHSPDNGQAFVAPKAKARLPEPATWLMLIGGMYGIGAALRRRHRASEAAFTAKVRAIAAERDAEDK